MRMKKKITNIFFLSLLMISVQAFAQDTLVGWTFPSTSADSLADFSAGTLNTSRYLSCQYGTYGFPSYHSIAIDYTTNGSGGSPDKCAKAIGWNDCVDSSYWMIKFKTTGYGNMKLYSKMQGGGSNPGPRDFKVQYKLPGSTFPWVDLAGGTIVCANDWTTGVIDGIDIPAECNNLSGQISIRWLLTSNLDINGNSLLSSGICKFDDIIITAVAQSGVERNDFGTFASIYPNPNHGSFTIDNIRDVKQIIIYDITSKCVYDREITFDNKVSFSNFNKGLYFVQLITTENDFCTSKIMVE